jgi:hypothetical protein
MLEAARRNTANAFEDLGPKNPLRQLREEDRQLLWAYLKLFAFMTEHLDRRELDEELGKRAQRTVCEAARFAARLEADVFQGALAKGLRPFISGFEALPEQLRAFADNIGWVLDLAGKPGRQGELFINQLLIMASELVRLRIGSPFDEHVAELFQTIATNKESDFSGAAIHKKRNYLKKNYPHLYQSTIRRAKVTFGSAPTN